MRTSGPSMLALVKISSQKPVMNCGHWSLLIWMRRIIYIEMLQIQLGWKSGGSSQSWDFSLVELYSITA